MHTCPASPNCKFFNLKHLKNWKNFKLKWFWRKWTHSLHVLIFGYDDAGGAVAYHARHEDDGVDDCHRNQRIVGHPLGSQQALEQQLLASQFRHFRQRFIHRDSRTVVNQWTRSTTTTLPECSLQLTALERTSFALDYANFGRNYSNQSAVFGHWRALRNKWKSSSPAAYTSGVNGGNEPTKRQRRGVAGRRCQTAARRRPASPLSLPRSANRRLRQSVRFFGNFLLFFLFLSIIRVIQVAKVLPSTLAGVIDLLASFNFAGAQ